MNRAPMYTDLCSVASSGMSSCADVSHGHHVTIGRYIAGLYMGAVRFFCQLVQYPLKIPAPKKKNNLTRTVIISKATNGSTFWSTSKTLLFG